MKKVEKKVLIEPTSSPKPAAPASMSFIKAMEEVLIGKKAHKLEWKDKSFWVEITVDDRISLHKPDGMYYAWTIMRSDTANNDWVIL